MLGTRELGIEGHRVIYQVTPDTSDNATAGDVIVLRVFGQGQERQKWRLIAPCGSAPEILLRC